MVPLGAACLILALPVAAYAVVAALLGTQRRPPLGRLLAARDLRALRPADDRRDRRSCAAFLRDDFSVELVADHSSTTTPVGYKMTAMWSSQAGSLLLWAWVLSIAASAVLYGTRRRHREVVPWATAVLGAARGLLHRADALRPRLPGRRVVPVLAPRPRAGRGRRAQSAAAPSRDGDPPADALLGLRLLLDPVRVRDRGAGRPPARRELDPLDTAFRAHRLDLPDDRRRCSARAGPTASWAGAATGAGTRSRTRR